MGLNFDQLIYFLPAFIVAIAVHEASHAFSATLLGDPSPRAAGRLSLNPLRHLDPLGTITLFMVGFGWGKPVYVNPAAFKVNPRTGMALTAVAGPVSNLLTAALVGIFYRFFLEPALLPQVVANRAGGSDWMVTVLQIVPAIVYINVMLAIFNLIPLPPLDGFSVMMGVLPRHLAVRVAPIARYGPGLLLLLFFVPYVLRIDFIGRVIGPPISYLFRLIIG